MLVAVNQVKMTIIIYTFISTPSELGAAPWVGHRDVPLPHSAPGCFAAVGFCTLSFFLELTVHQLQLSRISQRVDV